MDKIFVTVGGLLTVVFVYWFFFGKKPSLTEVAEGREIIEIKVDGGYKPAVIKVKKDRTVILKVVRRDTNECLEEIVLPDFKIREYLPLNQEINIKITPRRTGEFEFHCGMNMFRGKIYVS